MAGKDIRGINKCAFCGREGNLVYSELLTGHMCADCVRKWGTLSDPSVGEAGADGRQIRRWPLLAGGMHYIYRDDWDSFVVNRIDYLGENNDFFVNAFCRRICGEAEVIADCLLAAHMEMYKRYKWHRPQQVYVNMSYAPGTSGCVKQHVPIAILLYQIPYKTTKLRVGLVQLTFFHCEHSILMEFSLLTQDRLNPMLKGSSLGMWRQNARLVPPGSSCVNNTTLQKLDYVVSEDIRWPNEEDIWWPNEYEQYSETLLATRRVIEDVLVPVPGMCFSERTLEWNEVYKQTVLRNVKEGIWHG